MPSASSREQRRATINYRSAIVTTTEHNDPTPPLKFKRGRSSWEARVRHEALRLRADLASRQADSTRTMSSVDRQRIAKIGEYLDHADAALDHYFRRNWPVRLVIASRAYQEALASVYRASEDLLLVQSADAVAARLPSLRAAVRSYLSADDPRREIYLLHIDAALTNVGAERLAEAAQLAAQRSEERAGHRNDAVREE
jgi:hypothetical protein